MARAMVMVVVVAARGEYSGTTNNWVSPLECRCSSGVVVVVMAVVIAAAVAMMVVVIMQWCQVGGLQS